MSLFITAGIIGKNKYLRDPSVQSGPGSYQPPPIDSQPTFGTRQGYMQPAIPPIQSAYNPMMMNPMQPATTQPFNPTQNYNQVQNVLPPVAPSPNIPLLNPATVNPLLPPTAMNPPTEMSNGLSNSNFYNNSEMGVEAVPQNYSQGPSGWNDPPVFSSKSQVLHAILCICIFKYICIFILESVLLKRSGYYYILLKKYDVC